MVTAFILLMLKIVAVAAVAVFFVCVLTLMAFAMMQLFRDGRRQHSWDFMLRTRRIAFRAWLVALVAGVSMVAFAFATGQR
jgi:hypothetical protein